MDTSKLCYNEIVQSYYKSQMVFVPENCNGYLAVNKGDTIVWVNGFPLNPPVGAGLSGESTGLLGNKGEIYVGQNKQLQIVFNNAPFVSPWVIIVFKYYINQ